MASSESRKPGKRAHAKRRSAFPLSGVIDHGIMDREGKRGGRVDELLIADARQAVKELDRQGIFSYCINLDTKADDYVADIFGRQYTIIDKVEQLPQKLPELFISLTK